MNCENHLYKYLYDDLVAQIECGVLEYAQALPSQKQLCQQYNVGITTVRKVMRLLQEAGYVESSQGLPAKVAYHARCV